MVNIAGDVPQVVDKVSVRCQQGNAVTHALNDGLHRPHRLVDCPHRQNLRSTQHSTEQRIPQSLSNVRQARHADVTLDFQQLARFSRLVLQSLNIFLMPSRMRFRNRFFGHRHPGMPNDSLTHSVELQQLLRFKLQLVLLRLHRARNAIALG